MRFIKRGLRRADSDDAFRRYLAHKKAILGKIHESVWALDKLHLQDQPIDHVQNLGDAELVLTTIPLRIYFLGLIKTDAGPHLVESGGWVQHEVDEFPSGFILRVLLEDTEFFVAAKSIAVYNMHIRKWLIARPTGTDSASRAGRESKTKKVRK